MSGGLLLDTAFVQALLNRNDQYHAKAKEYWPRVEAAPLVVITEAVLLEIGNALSSINRDAAAKFIDKCYTGITQNLRVVPLTTELIKRSLELYSNRQ